MTVPGLHTSFRSPVVGGLVIVTGILTAGYVVTLRWHQYYVAFRSTAALVFGLIGLVASLMFPFIDRIAGLTVRDAIVSTLPLDFMTIMMSVLLPIVLAYFVVLYSAFSGPVETGESYR